MELDRDHAATAATRWAELIPSSSPHAVEITMRVRRLAARLEELTAEAVSDAGLTNVGDYDVLSALRRADGPLAPGDLASRLRITRAGVSGRLDRLEDAGLVTRRTALGDRRRVDVTLTSKGRATVDRAFKAAQNAQIEVLARLDASSVELLAQQLRRLAIALGDHSSR